MALALVLSSQDGSKGIVFDKKYTLAGMGTASCARAFMPQNEAATYQWIMGFISGLNASSGGHVGQQSDSDGIVGEVQLRCKETPSALLVQVTTLTYKTMAARL